MSVTADKVGILGWHNSNSRDNVPTPKPSQQPAKHSMTFPMLASATAAPGESTISLADPKISTMMMKNP